jgi:MFS family permease
MLNFKYIQNMNKKILSINIFSFFNALHYAVIIYYGSTFLSKFLGTEKVWLVYSFGAVFTLIFHSFLNRFLNKININSLVPRVTLFAILNLLLLFTWQIFTFTPYIQNILIILNFAIYIAFAQTLFLLVSIMLEDLSKDEETGALRGALISITSTGYLLAPFLSKIILQNGGNDKNLFLFSAFLCSLNFFIFKYFIKPLPKIEIHEQGNFKSDLKRAWKNKDIRNILILQTIIEMFYAGFVIYMPIKLNLLSISTTTYLGIILPIALTPFLFIPSWLGHLEDKMRDEKFILTLSFSLLTFVLAAFSIVNSISVVIWGIVIFFSRIAASAIETSTASYLFKKISVKNTAIITLYNSTQPIAYFISPILFGIVYYATENIDLIFITLCIITFIAINISFKLSDTENKEDNKRKAKSKII